MESVCDGVEISGEEMGAWERGKEGGREGGAQQVTNRGH